MSINNHYPVRRKKPVLIVVCLLALTVHVWGIYLLQNIGIKIRAKEERFLTHQILELGEKQAVLEESKRELIKRNEQLATVFQDLISDAVQLEAVSLHAPQFSGQEELLGAREAIEASELIEVNETAIDKTSLNDYIADEAPSERLESPLIHQLNAAEVVFEDEEGIFDELVEATNQILGDVLVENLSDLTEGPGLKVGLNKINEIRGTALHQQKETLSTKQNQYRSKVAPSGLKGDNGAKLVMDTAPLSRLEPLPIFPEMDESLLEMQSLHDEKNIAVDELGTIASSDDFNLDVRYIKRSNGKGYIFQLTFKPKPGVHFKRIRQNMFFLLDRSNSINRKRYAFTKQAILHSLDILNPGDTFNILVFDDKVVRFAKENIPWSKESVNEARKFLNMQDHGGWFASTDLYTSLGKIVPDVVADNEVNTAILLSDGDTFLKREKQRAMIKKWTWKNHGKVSLFSVASGGGNNLPLMELLSGLNKGRLAYSPSDEGIEQALTSLMKKIRTPIGKDIVATVIPSKHGEFIDIYPRNTRLPDLYQGSPYVIFGSTDSLQDFHIFLQGRYYGKWLDIKQQVSFTNALQGDSTIEKEWVLQKAFQLYEEYLNKGEIVHLREAKRLLKPLNIPLAFE